MTRTPTVVVVGGGPAGSVAAAFLAKEGVKVTLLEREHHPRHHIGESLQPSSLGMLDKHLGLGPAIAAQGFARKYGAQYVWGETREPWSVLFDERLDKALPGLTEESLLTGPYEHAWQVSRSDFDRLLFEEACRRGVDARQGVVVTAPVLEGGRVVGVELEGGEVLRADWVIDASGQRCLLGRAMRMCEDIDDMKATATYAYYDGCGGVPGPLGRHVQLIVTIDEGWIWFIPISPERTSVGVVVRERARMTRERFERILSEAPIPLAGGRMVAVDDGEELRFARDWSYACARAAGPGFVLVGDAACFVDPILSGGVDFAIRGAANAAVAILRVASGAADEETALGAYDAHLRQEYRAYLRLARYWYGNNRSVKGFFWEAHQEIAAAAVSTPLRAFVYLTSGRYAADAHFKVFQEWQEQRMFRALGVDEQRLKQSWKSRS